MVLTVWEHDSGATATYTFNGTVFQVSIFSLFSLMTCRYSGGGFRDSIGWFAGQFRGGFTIFSEKLPEYTLLP